VGVSAIALSHYRWTLPGEDWLWLLLELLGLRATRLLRPLHLAFSFHVPALTPASMPAGPRGRGGAWSLRGLRS